MKIITRSNFDLELYREEVVAENVNEYIGKQLIETWNFKYQNDSSLEYLALVEDDYVPNDGYKELMG